MQVQDQALLLVHGMWSSNSEFGYIEKYLASDQLAIISVNLKTYGQEQSEEKTADFSKWLEEIFNIYTKLCQQYKVVHIGGLSLGATLSLAFDIQYPATINGCIIAMSPLLKLDGWAMPIYAKYAIPLSCKFNVMSDYLYKETEPYGLKNEHMRAIVKKQFESGEQSIMGGNNIPVRFLNESLKAGKFVRKNIHKIKAPMLVIHSLEDETASIYNARILAERNKAKAFQKVELINSYHIITWDNERKQVVAHIKNFIHTQKT